MSDYLTDEEQIARLRSWWDENGTGLVVGLVVVIAGVVGWRWYESDRTEEVERASALYAEYFESEGEARDTLAISIDEQIPNTAYQTFALLHRAREAVEADDLAAAETLLGDAA